MSAMNRIHTGAKNSAIRESSAKPSTTRIATKNTSVAQGMMRASGIGKIDSACRSGCLRR